MRVWLDLETTGLNHKTNGVIELAILIERKNKIVDSLLLNIKPFKGCKFTKEALEINGKTKKQIKKYPSEKEQVQKLIEFLDLNKVSYTQLAGYNVQFDMRFLKELLRRHDIPFTNYFNYYDVDVYAIVKYLGLGKLYNKKLGTVCEKMGIDIENAHNAEDDIRATYDLYKKINSMFLKSDIVDKTDYV